MNEIMENFSVRARGTSKTSDLSLSLCSLLHVIKTLKCCVVSHLNQTRPVHSVAFSSLVKLGNLCCNGDLVKHKTALFPGEVKPLTHDLVLVCKVIESLRLGRKLGLSFVLFPNLNPKGNLPDLPPPLGRCRLLHFAAILALTDSSLLPRHSTHPGFLAAPGIT